MPTDSKALPPLSPAVFHILLALSAGDRHGYAIMKEAAEQSEGRVRLGPGTLYRSIQNLLSAGRIEEAGERADPASGDERRRYYRLTGIGREVVKNEARRLRRVYRFALRVGVVLGRGGTAGNRFPEGLGGRVGSQLRVGGDLAK